MIDPGSDIYRIYTAMWLKRSPYFKTASVVGLFAVVSYLLLLCLRGRKKLNFTDVNLSMVGFGRVTLINAREMIERRMVFNEIRQQTLARDSDLIWEDLRGSRVLLVASFTERNNIMGRGPDYGELSRLYTELPVDIKKNVFVMYAGVPPSQFEGKAGKLAFPESFRKLIRSQPNLELLMNTNRFIAITNKYKFNTPQLNDFKKWIISDKA